MHFERKTDSLVAIVGLFEYAPLKLDVPTIPIILGVLLGNHTQDNLRRAMVISGAEWKFLFNSSRSIGLWVAAIGGFIAPMFLRKFLSKPQRITD